MKISSKNLAFKKLTDGKRQADFNLYDQFDCKIYYYLGTDWVYFEVIGAMPCADLRSSSLRGLIRKIWRELFFSITAY